MVILTEAWQSRLTGRPRVDQYDLQTRSEFHSLAGCPAPRHPDEPAASLWRPTPRPNLGKKDVTIVYAAIGWTMRGSTSKSLALIPWPNSVKDGCNVPSAGYPGARRGGRAKSS
jgi:hypothetical protein